MKRTILTALFAINALFCVNQLQAISVKKAAWGAGTVFSGAIAVYSPVIIALAHVNAFWNELAQILLTGKSFHYNNRLNQIYLIGCLSGVASAYCAKYCFEKYKEQPE